MAAKSPFSGLKLSEQISVTPPPVDQRLFTSTKVRPLTETDPPSELAESVLFKRPPTATSTPLPQPLEPRNQGSKEARKLGSKEATLERRNQGALDAAPAQAGGVGSYAFDINERPYRQNTYAFTDEELNALEDMKITIRRNLGLDVTKNDLVRCAIHGLIEEFNRLGSSSSVLNRLRKRNSR